VLVKLRKLADREVGRWGDKTDEGNEGDNGE